MDMEKVVSRGTRLAVKSQPAKHVLMDVVMWIAPSIVNTPHEICVCKTYHLYQHAYTFMYPKPDNAKVFGTRVQSHWQFLIGNWNLINCCC